MNQFEQPFIMPDYIKNSLLNAFQRKDKIIIQYIQKEWFKMIQNKEVIQHV